MVKKFWLVIGLLLSVATYAEDSIAAAVDTTAAVKESPQPKKEKKQIYYGTQVKVDILSPVLIPGLNKWRMQHYEMAVNVRLVKRFYPTIELGYAVGDTRNDSIQYSGQGGFFRVGCDLCPFKKHPESPHALLVGVRLGTAVQGFEQTVSRGTRADCWGEIAAGCQVEICQSRWQTAKGERSMSFYMGWMGRIKFLFTRETEGLPMDQMTAVYIPGYGSRDNIGWGANYYLGWRF